MALLKKLKELEELRVCDEETVEALNIDNFFIRHTVDSFLNEYKKNKDKLPDATRYHNRKRISFGSKLLFLEKLVQSDQKTQKQVIEWLDDTKRNLLFTGSDYGDVYGELLVAKEEGTLDQYRKTFNPNSQAQPTFKLERILEVTYTHDTSSIEKGRELIEKKLDKVLKRMEDLFSYGIGYIDEKRFVDPEYVKKELISNYDKRRKLGFDDAEEAEGILTYDLPENLESYFIELLEIGHITEDDYKKIDQNSVFQCQSDHSNFDERFLGLRKAILNVKDKIYKGEGLEDKLVLELKRRILNRESTDIDGFEESEEYERLYDLFEKKQIGHLYKNEISELKSLSEENVKLNEIIEEARKLSSKYKNPKTLKYEIELSEKDPLDVTFGNDSGCCVGIYENSGINIGNANSIPYYIADNATYIFDISQQRGEGKRRRTGIVIAFESKDDLGNKILACNSIELSPAMNPHSCVEDVVAFTEDALIEFGKQSGFKAILMSTHDYNTSYNYSKNQGKKPKREEKLIKLNPNIEREFYSEIVGPLEGEISVTKEGFYLIYDKRKFERSETKPLQRF